MKAFEEFSFVAENTVQVTLGNLTLTLTRVGDFVTATCFRKGEMRRLVLKQTVRVKKVVYV